MRQSLVKKYHQDNSSTKSFDHTVTHPAPAWGTVGWQKVVKLLGFGRYGLSYMSYAQQQLQIVGNSEALLRRISTHLIVILLAILAIGLSRMPWWESGVRAIQPLKPAPTQLATSTEAAKTETLLTLPTQLNNADITVLVPRPVLLTFAPEPEAASVPEVALSSPNENGLATYFVQSGDTIYAIADKLGLAPETLMWANPSLENNPDILTVGQELTVLPLDGVYHQVGSTDTIAGIAATFKVDMAAIIEFSLNNLDPETLIIHPGDWLVVPGGTKPYVPRTIVAFNGTVPEGATVGSGAFIWPASGTIFQGYWSAHPGLDIAAWLGAPIKVADSGHVIFAGWDNTGYGYTVVIDHGNGFQTLYGHMQSFYVSVGDDIAKGEQIGEMGSTGNSTGPHVHFEIRQGTVQRNPGGFLP